MKTYIVILLALIFTSCAPKIKNFDSYNKQYLPQSSFLPTKKDLNSNLPKVVVFKFDSNNIETAKQAKLEESLAEYIENLISKNNLANILDRSSTKKLKDEIKLSELNQTGSYKGPQIADYAVSGSVSNASFSKKYKSSGVMYDSNTGALVSVPARYIYESDVEGSLKIYEIPSLKVLKNIKFSGYSTRQENVKSDGLNIGSISFGKKDPGLEKDNGLVRKAAGDAIKAVEPFLKQALIKKGYILEKRVHEDKVIFKVSLGSNNGIKHGDNLEIVGKYEIENPITKESEIEKRILAKGKVTNLINPKSCWIVLNKDKEISKIRLGDIVNMMYKQSEFTKIFRKIRKIKI